MFHIRESVQGIRPYKPGKPIEELKRERGITGEIVKLASNENPLGSSPRVIEAIRETADQVHFYPDNAAFELTAAIADYHKIEPERIICSRGGSGLLEMAARLLVDPGEEIIYSEMSFLLYPLMARLAGAVGKGIPLRDDFSIDTDGMLKAVTEKTRLIYLPNPNNPTGVYTPKVEMERLLDGLPDHVVLVLDEAYCDFATAVADDYAVGLPWLLAGKRNLLLMRTLSKSHGLAGLRMGYGIGDPELIAQLHKVRAPFNVTLPTQAAAIAALKDRDHVAKSVKNNSLGREQINKGLRELGIEPLSTAANFVLFPVGSQERAHAIDEGLKDRGVIIRHTVAFGMPNHLRVSIGLPEQNQIFLDKLKEVLASPA